MVTHAPIKNINQFHKYFTDLTYKEKEDLTWNRIVNQEETPFFNIFGYNNY
jgi:hypothetical protein